jgi:GT2 family glycosyltransferase
MAEAPAVSVIIPTHQRRESLRRALGSLDTQSAATGSYEVVVGVDGSTDGTHEMLDGLSVDYPLRAVPLPHRGRAAACNAAIGAAAGDILIVLDDDMEVVPEFVERHRAHHRPGTRCCVLGAVPVVVEKGSPLAARYVEAKFAAHLERLADPAHRELPRSFYSGNTSLRAELFREAGGFDESFTAYGNEDVELALRLRAAGASIEYDPLALARQRYEKDLPGLAEDTFAKGGTTVLLAVAHPGIFGDLRLAEPRESSRPWLAARAVLLAITRLDRRVAGAVFTAASLLERLGLWRAPLFYRAVLDYAFWAGVDTRLGDHAEENLRSLHAELHRGPIDLLLHG